ncbi:Alpha/Beta hydrolase fold [Phytophthora cactorum]|nr:Alpha/Beta hydrolase fold [Phytophthora cactorum]
MDLNSSMNSSVCQPSHFWDAWEHNYAPVGNDITLHYIDVGPRDATPVVLVHGWPDLCSAGDTRSKRYPRRTDRPEEAAKLLDVAPRRLFTATFRLHTDIDTSLSFIELLHGVPESPNPIFTNASKLLDQVEVEYYLTEYARSGFAGGCNYYAARFIDFNDERELPRTILHKALLISPAEDRVLKPEMAVACANWSRTCSRRSSQMLVTGFYGAKGRNHENSTAVAGPNLRIDTDCTLVQLAILCPVVIEKLGNTFENVAK